MSGFACSCCLLLVSHPSWSWQPLWTIFQQLSQRFFCYIFIVCGAVMICGYNLIPKIILVAVLSWYRYMVFEQRSISFWYTIFALLRSDVYEYIGSWCIPVGSLNSPSLVPSLPSFFVTTPYWLNDCMRWFCVSAMIISPELLTARPRGQHSSPSAEPVLLTALPMWNRSLSGLWMYKCHLEIRDTANLCKTLTKIQLILPR